MFKYREVREIGLVTIIICFINLLLYVVGVMKGGMWFPIVNVVYTCLVLYKFYELDKKYPITILCITTDKAEKVTPWVSFVLHKQYLRLFLFIDYMSLEDFILNKDNQELAHYSAYITMDLNEEIIETINEVAYSIRKERGRII